MAAMGELEAIEDSSGYQLRSYQLEMLEENMRRNIIVAMDTGSGKTLIAVARIKAALEICPVDQIVWFLGPTVTLVQQQHQVIAEFLPSYQTRSLFGADGVDHWSDRQTWNDVLFNIRIVASTHRVVVLLDALVHGFVSMSQLALLVFDEAHHCSGKHDANRIMKDFYHPIEGKAAGKVPAILGLTASPVTKKTDILEVVEKNLNAISRTPKLHREEMLRHVNRPQLVKLTYPKPPEDHGSMALEALRCLCANLDIEQDPYVIMLKADPNTCDSTRLRDTLSSRKTYCQKLITNFYQKAANIYQELGLRAVEFFIRSCVEKLCADDLVSVDFEMTEKLFLKKTFAHLNLPIIADELIQDGLQVSPKVECLINFLKGVDSAEFTGLVFVQTRAAVATLCHLLSTDNSTRNVFRISTFVGTSSMAGRKFNIGELLDVKLQKNTLDDLRCGRKNLVITTSALEEGIDVSACNHVICFEKPPNFKSFIQRRGRARQRKSKLIMMFEEGTGTELLSDWQELEAEMINAYMDDMRRLEEIQKLENQENGYREFLVESSGAKLTLDDAVPHLHHFCDTLPTSQYADLRPIFTYSDGPQDGERKTVVAKVLLPVSVDASVREACSTTQWLTQKLAKRDAAFEAYVALFKAGLVMENLLPLRYDKDIAEAVSAVNKRPSLMEVVKQMNFWSDMIAPKWGTRSELYRSHMTLYYDGVLMVQMFLILPQPLSRNMCLELGRNDDISITIKLDDIFSESYSSDRLSTYARTTDLLLGSVYRNRLNDAKNDFACLFGPANVKDLEGWLERNSGAIPGDAVFDDNLNGLQIGLIRNLAENRAPYCFDRMEDCQMESHASDHVPAILSDDGYVENERYVRAVRLTKKADSMQKLFPGASLTHAHAEILPVSECEVDNLPSIFSRFSLLMPLIMHQIDVQKVAESLCVNILPSLRIKDLRLIIAATSAPAAQERTNYQRLEFIGDSILKFFTSLTLMAQHLNWHEGILTGKKDHVVSNGNLAISAVRVGLPKYIRNVQFAAKKWRPLYVSNLLRDHTEETREMSTKTLADVVEALIGAAYVDGGDEKVLACLAAFLPEMSWISLSQHHDTLRKSYELNISIPPNLIYVEQLVDHTFQYKALLIEALTHPSHRGPNSTASYQRLEFLGDSILDNIVVRRAFRSQPPIPTPSLHLIRTTLVNGSFLAFLALTLSTPCARTEIVSGPNNCFSTVQMTVFQHLWEFMRHANTRVRISQQTCLARFKSLQNPIMEAIRQEEAYPWVLLAQLDAPKYFSDIIESLIGAIYIDTSGSMAACESFLGRLGIMAYLERIIRENVELLHPKEKLGQLADTETVTYSRKRVGKEEKREVEEEGEKVGDDAEEQGKLTCTVTIGDREIVQVGDGISKMEVETRAAAEAILILGKEGRRLPKRV